MRKLFFVIFISAIFVLFAGSQVNAGDVSNSVIITEEGTYNVTQDFTGYIEIKADNVTIIGNGYEIYRNSRSLPVISVDRSRNIQIVDLKIRGGNSGIVAHYCKKMHLKFLKITAGVGYALNMSLSNVDSSKITNCEIFGGMYGIDASNFDANNIKDNNINSNIGIYVASGEDNFGAGNTDRNNGKIHIGQPENSFINIYDELPHVATDCSLSQNYPNPFNPKTTISYNIQEDGHVALNIYNTLGQKVFGLVNEYKVAGVYKSNFDASGLPSGIYFYRFTAKNYTDTKKMMLLE
jgi:hypothetical protein